MSNGLDLTAAKLELVREITVAYLSNIYPKPLTSLTEDARQKTIEQHRKEISEFMKSIYDTVSKIKAAPSGK